jgi:hypothetical protein
MSMIPTQFETADHDRLISIGSDVKYLIRRLDEYIRDATNRFDKIEKDHEALCIVVSEHQMEDSKEFKKLKTEVVKYVVLFIIGAVLGAILMEIGLGA